MYRAKLENQWNHTCEIQACIINNGFYRPSPLATSTALNPMAKHRPSTSKGIGLDDVRLAVVGPKKNG